MSNTNIENVEPVIPLPTALIILASVFVGTIAAAIIVPSWLPGLTASILGPQPKVFWDLARSAGIAAYLLMWLSVVFGLVITNRMARLWLGGPSTVDLHQFTSLLGMGFALFHGLILLGDSYMNFNLLQIALPFTTFNYSPFWVGLGQIAFYLMLPVTFSFYLRRRLGPTMWRTIHYATFIIFAFITVHGMLAGTDAMALVGMYAMTTISVFFLTIYRVLSMATVKA